MAAIMAARMSGRGQAFDTALLPFDALIGRHLGRSAPDLMPSVRQVRDDLHRLRSCVAALRSCPCEHTRRNCLEHFSRTR
jgi:hypothetical protein